MTGSEMVMKMMAGLLIGMLVGIPLLIWVVVLVGLVRRTVRDVHERLLDRAATVASARSRATCGSRSTTCSPRSVRRRLSTTRSSPAHRSTTSPPR